MKQKKYTITILLNDFELAINLTTDRIDLIQLHNIMGSLDEIGDIKEVTEHETD